MNELVQQGPIDPIAGRVMSVLRTIRPAPLAESEPLTDAGFTSVDMVKIMLEVEAEFDLMIPQPDITPENFRSAQSIAGMLRRLTSS
jgi:acyl carrier protein